MNTSIHDVIAKEKEAILRKRNKLGISEADQPLDDTLLGVAPVSYTHLTLPTSDLV